MLYRILRTNERGTTEPLARAGSFSDVTEVTDLCQRLNDLALQLHSGWAYSVDTVKVRV